LTYACPYIRINKLLQGLFAKGVEGLSGCPVKMGKRNGEWKRSHGMSKPLKIWKTEPYRKMTNPTPGEWYRAPILGDEEQAKGLGGLMVILPPGKSVPYHYHKNRESLLLVLNGEAVELYEDKEHAIQAGDVIFIPAGAKHAVINRTDKEIRFLEFFTHPPMGSDFVKVE